MTVIVHSHGKWIVLSREGAVPLTHEVPRRNKYFKEELRGFRADIRNWLLGDTCDHLVVYVPAVLSFYRRVLYRTVLTTLQKRRTILVTVYRESAETIR